MFTTHSLQLNYCASSRLSPVLGTGACSLFRCWPCPLDWQGLIWLVLFEPALSQYGIWVPRSGFALRSAENENADACKKTSEVSEESQQLKEQIAQLKRSQWNQGLIDNETVWLFFWLAAPVGSAHFHDPYVIPAVFPSCLLAISLLWHAIWYEDAIDTPCFSLCFTGTSHFYLSELCPIFRIRHGFFFVISVGRYSLMHIATAAGRYPGAFPTFICCNWTGWRLTRQILTKSPRVGIPDRLLLLLRDGWFVFSDKLNMHAIRYPSCSAFLPYIMYLPYTTSSPPPPPIYLLTPARTALCAARMK